jgi:hypothetical protein
VNTAPRPSEDLSCGPGSFDRWLNKLRRPVAVSDRRQYITLQVARKDAHLDWCLAVLPSASNLRSTGKSFEATSFPRPPQFISLDGRATNHREWSHGLCFGRPVHESRVSKIYAALRVDAPPTMCLNPRCLTERADCSHRVNPILAAPVSLARKA